MSSEKKSCFYIKSKYNKNRFNIKRDVILLGYWMKKTWILMIMMSALFILSSCGGGGGGGDDDGGEKNNTNIAFLDVTDADALYINPGSLSANSSGLYEIQKTSGFIKNKFYKITNSGIPKEVKFLDKNHQEISDENYSFQPEYVERITNNYILFGLGPGLGSASVAYLCRISDGAVFKIPSELGCPNKNIFDFKNANLIRVAKNNIYYLYVNKIYKINLEGINSLQSTLVSLSTDHVCHFEVDKNGNLVYSGSLISNTSTPVCRVVKTNGGFANLSSSYMGGNWCFKGWLAPDGFVYCMKNNVINKMVVDENFVFYEEEYGNMAPGPYNAPAEYKIDLNNTVIIVSTNDNPCSFFEVYNNTDIPRIITLSDGLEFSTITAVGAANNYYYIAGVDSTSNTVFKKINPETDTHTDVLPMNQYDIFSFTVSDENEIIFNALRMSDGKKILARVSNLGVLSILDEESDSKVISLERIR